MDNILLVDIFDCMEEAFNNLAGLKVGKMVVTGYSHLHQIRKGSIAHAFSEDE